MGMVISGGTIIVPPGQVGLDAPIELGRSVRMVGSRYLVEGLAAEALHGNMLNLLVVDIAEKYRPTLAACVRQIAATFGRWASEIWGKYTF